MSVPARPAPVHSVVVAGIEVGDGAPVRVMAGPCSVEGFAQLLETARVVRQAGARLLRGGAFKPRTSPYSFQGLGRRALEMLREVADELGMAVVSEAVAEEDVALVDTLADMIQIGARNMDNQALLRTAAATERPILLKRGMASTLDEVVDAVSFLRRHGNGEIILCERGSRTFEPSTRNSIDIAAIPELQRRTGLPVIVDPSHGTGRRDLVEPIALAGIAAGADGVIVEVHPDPDSALSDGPQSLHTEGFDGFMAAVNRVALAMGRGMR